MTLVMPMTYTVLPCALSRAIEGSGHVVVADAKSSVSGFKTLSCAGAVLDKFLVTTKPFCSTTKLL